MDDWIDYPVQFPQGSCYDLRDADSAPSRLSGCRSVKNMQGGILRPSKPETRNPIGFTIPRSNVNGTR